MEGINPLHLSNLVDEVSQHYQQLLNIKPRRTKLQILPRKEWQGLCKKLNLNHNSEGIFLSRNLTAYLIKDSRFLPLNLFMNILVMVCFLNILNKEDL